MYRTSLLWGVKDGFWEGNENVRRGTYTDTFPSSHRVLPLLSTTDRDDGMIRKVPHRPTTRRSLTGQEKE